MSSPSPETTPATPPPGDPATPPPAAPAPTPPAAPAAPPQGNPGARTSADDVLRSIQETLGALPEKLVDAVREAAPPAPVVNTPTDTKKESGGNRFAKWWFTK